MSCGTNYGSLAAFNYDPWQGFVGPTMDPWQLSNKARCHVGPIMDPSGINYPTVIVYNLFKTLLSNHMVAKTSRI